MATTSTLEDNYEDKARLEEFRAHRGTTYRRWFRVPHRVLSTLMPATGDTHAVQTDQIVQSAVPYLRRGAVDCWLAVTYFTTKTFAT